MKYLIFGLGNIGPEYENTRHNIGFTILDALAEASNIVFSLKRHAFVTQFKFKGRIFILIKPTTFMNLSGKAVNYWITKEKLVPANILVIADDIALPFGQLRLRAKGGDGGHNGLRSIAETLRTNQFARLRFGIGKAFEQGEQINHVLGSWDQGEKDQLPDKLLVAHDLIRSFGTLGVDRTMNVFNIKT
ncbi:MAG: aminoacyl-tRNA hydrolase [Bacteroidales bacterium]|nr:aminoacyl-tRNA hydrolase [Bacteroidales bacterium]